MTLTDFVEPVSELAEPIEIRRAGREDIARLIEIENQVFDLERISSRSFREFVAKPTASLLVALIDRRVVGYALVLFRNGSAIARLYSIAVATEATARGVGSALLTASETAARDRGEFFLRLEVRVDNLAAISLYKRHGYKEFGRLQEYYADAADALRLEKSLVERAPVRARDVPYYPQTTEFTCGPAAMMMVLAAADPGLTPNRHLELELWRESTTIFMTSGLGGCEPVGMAVALARRGLAVEVQLTQAPPLFLESVRQPIKREVMTIAQETFAEQAEALGIALKLQALDRLGLTDVLDAGGYAIVLISAWRMYHEQYPHWILVYGHDDRAVFAHDPWIDWQDHETALAKAHLAIPWPEFEKMTSYGKPRLRAAVVIRGPKR